MKNICLCCAQPFYGVSHEGLHPSCFSSWFGVEATLKFERLSKRYYVSEHSQIGGTEWEKIASSRFEGIFPKRLAELGHKKYILKLGQDSQCELPQVEYLSNQLARLLGLRVADHYLISCDRLHGAVAFVTSDFMQEFGSGAKLKHIYQYLTKPEQFTCEGLLKLLNTTPIKDPREAIKQFVWVCLVDALIGNNDRHGSNIAFVESQGRVSLAPFYDNTSFIGVVTNDLLKSQINPIGTIPTAQSAEPTMTAYVEEFRRLGYKQLIAQFKKHYENSRKEIEEMVGKSFVSSERQRALLRLIGIRGRELQLAAG